MNLLTNKIFIVSLLKYYSFSKKRTTKLLETLKDLNFNTEKIYFVGVNGANLKNKKINSQFISSKKYDFNKNIGTLGCALSHIIILKLIQIKKMYENILLFEEDVPIIKNFNFLYEFLPNNFDIIYLNSYRKDFFYTQTELGDNPYFRKINKPLPYGCDATGLQALIINGKNINKILNILLPVEAGLDAHYLNFYEEINQYYTNPDLNLFGSSPGKQSLRWAIDLKYR
jgi:GR25 family glycosyltransferase involved in LPS biosynthesis